MRAALGQPAAFSGLLGGPGRYAITPSDPWNVWGGYYETGSLISRSRWGGGSAHAQQRKHRGVSRVAVVGLSDLRIAGLWRRGE